MIAHDKNDLLRIVNEQPLDWDLYGPNSIEDTCSLIRRDPDFQYGKDCRKIFDSVLDELLDCKAE